jgi:hypothetical protein
MPTEWRTFFWDWFMYLQNYLAAGAYPLIMITAPDDIRHVLQHRFE